jgi:hypothetical protein
MAILQITMNGTYFDQMVINRWTYVSSGTPAAVSLSFALASAFGFIPEGTPSAIPSDKPFGYTMGQLASAFTVSAAVIENLYDVVDFYERPFPTPYPGSQSGDFMSPAVAYGFRTNRVRTDVDRGTKRLAGVVEGQIGNGGVIASGMMTALTSVATLWTDVLEYDDEGSTISFTPCVLSKEEYTTPSGRRAYKKYATEAAQLSHTAIGVSWQPSTTVRTQVSRQYGHGA